MKPRNVDFLKELPIAHRGYFDAANPENSMAAFNRAIERHYGIEMDLQLTKDNQVVVFHDNSVARMCGKPLNIKDYTYAELLTFKLGKTDHQIPLFKDFLALVHGQVPLVIELKSEPAKNKLLPQYTYELLKDYQGQYVVQSFNPLLVRYFKKHHPEILRGQLVGDFTKDPKMNKLEARIISGLHLNVFSKPDYLNSYFTHRPPKLVKFQAKGGCVICYTAKTPEEYQKAFENFDNVIFEGFEPTYFAKHKQMNGK